MDVALDVKAPAAPTDETSVQALEQQNGLVILFGWMGSNPKIVSKYCEIYSKYGFDTKIYCASLDKVTFNFIGQTFYTRKVLDNTQRWLEKAQQESKTDCKPLLFAHVMSTGGSFIFGKLNRLVVTEASKYGSIKFDGVIFDSSPSQLEIWRLTIGIFITLSNVLEKTLIDGKCCKISSICCICKYCIFYPIKWLLLLVFFVIFWPIIVLFGIIFTITTCEYRTVLDHFEFVLFGLTKKELNRCNQLGTINIQPSLHITTEMGVDLMCPQEHTDILIDVKKKFCNRFNIPVIEKFPDDDDNDGDSDKDTTARGNDNVVNVEEKAETANDIDSQETEKEKEKEKGKKIEKYNPILIIKKVFENSDHVMHYKLYKEEYTQLVQKFIDYCIKRYQSNLS